MDHIFQISEQCDAVTENKCNLGFHEPEYEVQLQEVRVPLHLVLVKLHLEHYVLFWAQHFKEDEVKLERVQKQTT